MTDCEADLGHGSLVSETSTNGDYVRVALATFDTNSMVTWSDANAYCSCEYKTTLASIHTDDDNFDAFDSTWYATYGYIWIGLNDIDSEGDFVNADGSDYDYWDFGSAQPDNDNDQDCVAFGYSSARWNDFDCDGNDGNQVVAWACNGMFLYSFFFF